MTDAPARPRAQHEIALTVRGYHLDLYGHVNNARYLEFLEEARWAWFEERTDLERILGGEVQMVMVRLEINYRYPAGIGDRLAITTRLGEVRTHSAVFHQEIHLATTGAPVVDADITVVIVDDAGRAVPIEGGYRKFLDQLA
ncbi:MAG: thioesterase family protein [Candidatus Nanopelagicales bacterium]